MHTTAANTKIAQVATLKATWANLQKAHLESWKIREAKNGPIGSKTLREKCQTRAPYTWDSSPPFGGPNAPPPETKNQQKNNFKKSFHQNSSKKEWNKGGQGDET